MNDYWIILICGNRKRKLEPNGMIELCDKLGEFRAENVYVCLRNYHDDFESLANTIYLFGKHHKKKAKVIIAAYSMGCHNSLCYFINRLDRYRIDVESIVLSDPVAKSRWKMFAFLTFFTKNIILPPVKKLRYFIQRTQFPKGHFIKCRYPLWEEQIKPEKILKKKHSEMDDCEEFHLAVKEECELLIK